jgi:hypothetical protein
VKLRKEKLALDLLLLFGAGGAAPSPAPY